MNINFVKALQLVVFTRSKLGFCTISMENMLKMQIFAAGVFALPRSPDKARFIFDHSLSLAIIY